jgi:hypothetical protein
VPALPFVTPADIAGIIVADTAGNITGCHRSPLPFLSALIAISRSLSTPTNPITPPTNGDIDTGRPTTSSALVMHKEGRHKGRPQAIYFFVLHRHISDDHRQ